MREDDVLREVRAAREAYAESHGYDVRAMVVDLRSRDLAGDWTVVRRPPRHPKSVALEAILPTPASENGLSQEATRAIGAEEPVGSGATPG